jgi:hypothetical protein
MLYSALRVSIPRYRSSQHRVEATGTLNYYSWFVLLCCSFAPDLGGFAVSACLKKAPPKPCHLLRHQQATAWGQHQGILQTSDSVRILNKSLKCVPLLQQGLHARRATREQGIQGKDRKYAHRRGETTPQRMMHRHYERTVLIGEHEPHLTASGLPKQTLSAMMPCFLLAPSRRGSDVMIRVKALSKIRVKAFKKAIFS